jgi:hypothetical protein
LGLSNGRIIHCLDNNINILFPQLIIKLKFLLLVQLPQSNYLHDTRRDTEEVVPDINNNQVTPIHNQQMSGSNSSNQDNQDIKIKTE